mgnify:CR=1 FL=1
MQLLWCRRYGSDEGGMITVTGRKIEEDIYISIEDNGMGMREEVVENILTDNSKVPKTWFRCRRNKCS